MALLRVALLTNLAAAEFKPIQVALQRDEFDWDSLLQEAIYEGFDPATFEHIAPDMRWELLHRAVVLTFEAWRLDRSLARALAVSYFDADVTAVPVGLRLALAELFLLRPRTLSPCHPFDRARDRHLAFRTEHVC
jgi:hypothetical protein